MNECFKMASTSFSWQQTYHMFCSRLMCYVFRLSKLYTAGSLRRLPYSTIQYLLVEDRYELV